MRAYASEMLVGSIHVREFDTAILCSQIWSSAVSVHIKAIIGAEEGTRTPTPLRVHGPEPCASANSATSAREGCERSLAVQEALPVYRSCKQLATLGCAPHTTAALTPAPTYWIASNVSSSARVPPARNCST